ncbi:MAG: molybdenum cofactor biosynthesis protein MoaE [Planctomycetota bacterium]|jgi:molybdopterin synthase catalytic subunit
MNIRVLFLGPARDLSGCEESTIALESGATVAVLRDALITAYPGLKSGMEATRIAVNESFVAEDAVMAEGDVVALIPPVSGGSTEDSADDGRLRIELSEKNLNVTGIHGWISGNPAFGGVCWFEGVTRAERDTDHGRLHYLEYEAYAEMAVKKMRELASTAVTRMDAGLVAMAHRVGCVPPGEPSVVIAVASPHRAEAFAACRWLIDTLKQDVPIWKRDVFEDGYSQWVTPGTPGNVSPGVKGEKG